MNYDDDDDDAGGSVSFLGTPLPELDESAVPRKRPLAVEEQIVTDEQGRRRFHGAFTGGFSAGFFNTAGSRDGWTPKHFKSSRSARAGAGVVDGAGDEGGSSSSSFRAQRPEDFMDDEDRGEFGFAPQGLKASGQFRQPTAPAAPAAASQERKRKAAEPEQEGPIPGVPVLEQVLKPAHDTIGNRLLRNMGWRPGQGIGPRITRKQKSRQKSSNLRMYGCSLPGADKSSDENSDEDDKDDGIDPKYRDFRFAPDDIPDFVAQPKDNMFGIGYSGLDRTSVLGGSGHFSLFEGPSSSSIKFQDKKNKKNVRSFTGQAFGVGAFEEEDGDIYAGDDMSRYDFELTPSSAEARDIKSKKKRSGGSRWGEAQVEELAKCIEGFQLAKTKSLIKKNFPLPELPKNFQPRAGGGARKSRFEPEPSEVLKTTNPTPAERQRALAIPSERATTSTSPSETPATTESREQLQKFLSTNMPQQQLGSFQPFARDPDKQKRYEKYLVCLKNKRRDALPLLQPKNMTEWEREREKVEFERAALLYRPMTGNMDSKFVSAGSTEDVDDTVSVPMDASDSEAQDAKRAAQMKMFGKMTRTKVEWHPARMLCLRFNVKNPFGNDYSEVGVPKVQKSKFELFNFVNNPTAAAKSATAAAPEATATAAKPEEGTEPKTEGDEVDALVQEEERRAVEQEQPVEKPPIDLFKSIFLDSSSEEEEDKEEDESKKGDNDGAENSKAKLGDKSEPSSKSNKASLFGTELEEEEQAKKKPWEEEKKNVLRNQAPAKGIFANVDFDALNRKKKAPKDRKDSPKRPEEKEETSREEKKPSVPGASRNRPTAADFFEAEVSEEEKEEEDASYGPAKPATLPQNQATSRLMDESSSSEDSSNEWSEKSSTKKSKKKKKKHSSKKEKKKQKSSKKKKKRTKSKKRKHKKKGNSSDSFSDSESSD